METLNLNIDKDNDLRFSVNVDGADGDPVAYRLVIESGRMSFNFPGYVTAEKEVQIIVPTLAKTMREGTYDARLEVQVGDRVFSPLASKAVLRESIKIAAAPIAPPPAPRTTVAVSGVRIADPARAAFVENRAELQRAQRVMESRESESARSRSSDPVSPIRARPGSNDRDAKVNSDNDFVELEKFRKTLGLRG